MFKITLLFAFAVSVSQAALPVTQRPGLFGEMPAAIHHCLGRPSLLDGESANRCNRMHQHSVVSQCVEYTCLFNQSGWLEGEKVDRARVSAHLAQYGAEHPAWAPAVARVRAACLADDLPPQGKYLNCPPYDVWLCILSGFVKNATPSQWSTEAECEHPRQFAAECCPLCPGQCFAPLAPAGSCDACPLKP